jgi:hypothetical protein
MAEPSQESFGELPKSVLKEMRIEISAVEVVVVKLIELAIKNNPEFEKDVLREFDTVLGRRLAKRGTPSEVDGEIRGRVRFLIETPKLSHDVKLTEIKKLTLRRRFLNWLERG